ncbi:DUF3964 domain-containing protein, partial [Bacillus paranthracis]
KQAIIGRIHEVYLVSVGTEGAWKYQLFRDDSQCREFFVTLPYIAAQQLAFWLISSSY